MHRLGQLLQSAVESILRSLFQKLLLLHTSPLPTMGRSHRVSRNKAGHDCHPSAWELDAGLKVWRPLISEQQQTLENHKARLSG